MSAPADVAFHAPDGVALHGRLRLPAGSPRGVALLCHPHPTFGGTMDVWLLPAIAERLADDGWAALRFDFRGVGRGGQVSADGRDEVADLAGACDLAHRHAPAASRCAVVGWSFGALIALRYGLDDRRVTDWVGIAPPTGPAPGVRLPPLPDVGCWPARRTVIVGDSDQFFPAEHAGVLAPDAVRVVAGTDHFFLDRDAEVAALVAEALA